MIGSDRFVIGYAGPLVLIARLPLNPSRRVIERRPDDPTGADSGPAR